MDDPGKTTINKESSLEDPSQSITSNILDDHQNLSVSLSSSSTIIPGESTSSSSTSITLPPDLSSSSSSSTTTSSELNPTQHPIFALPMHQQNPSQVIIPPINEQSPAFMIPLPTIYVPIIPLNPWQMATLKSRVKHQLKLKRKASSSSISHRLKISRKKIQKRARVSTSQGSMGEDPQNQEQEHSTSSYFQENENDDEFLVVVDVDMSGDDEDEDSDSTDEDENENENENQVQSNNLKPSDLPACHSSTTTTSHGGDGGLSPSTSTSSSSTFSLGHRTSSRNLLHQVKELSQQLLAKLTDSELRLKNNNSRVNVQNIEIIETSRSESPPSKSSATEKVSDTTLPNSSISMPMSNTQSISTLPPPLPSSSASSSSSPISSSNTLENKDSNPNVSKSEEGETAETETEAEVEAETTEEDPEFEEEYEPVDPEETENQNQADEDDEEPEGGNSTDEATTSNPNTRTQPDLFKGCLALSSEVILSYGRISSLHEKLHAILYGEHHHVVIGGFLCSLSYTFKAFPTDYNNNSNSKETFNNNNNNNNNSSSSSTILNCSHPNINNNNCSSRYTGNNNSNNNTVANGYCIGFYLDDLDPNTFEMEIQDGRIKVAGRRDDIDLTLDIHIAAPVHIEDIIVDHFKANSLLWLKIYF